MEPLEHWYVNWPLPSSLHVPDEALLIGKYGAQVNGALDAAHQPTDDAHIRESLFHCNGGDNGDISFITYCGGGCKDGGKDRSDYC